MYTDTKENAAQQISSLMEDAIKACNELYDYTAANFAVFSGEDDEKITEAIDSRERIVDTLAGLESEIDRFLNKDGGCPCNQDELPYTVEKFRKTAWSILDKVEALDLKAMNMVSQRMQEYKDETLKLRNKKNLSAYMRASTINNCGSHYDCKK